MWPLLIVNFSLLFFSIPLVYANSTELIPNSVLSLKPEIYQPKCSIFQMVESDLLEEVENIESIISLDFRSVTLLNNGYLNYLNERDKLKFQNIAEAKYIEIELNLDSDQYPIVSSYEVIAMQLYGITDFSNYNRFIFSPDNLIEKEGNKLTFKIKLNLFDVCINKSLSLVLLKDCDRHRKMPVECIDNQLCEDLPVHHIDQCKTQNIFNVNLNSLSDAIGIRKREIGRTYP
jgi:hypothetical protein